MRFHGAMKFVRTKELFELWGVELKKNTSFQIQALSTHIPEIVLLTYICRLI